MKTGISLVKAATALGAAGVCLRLLQGMPPQTSGAAERSAAPNTRSNARRFLRVARR